MSLLCLGTTQDLSHLWLSVGWDAHLVPLVAQRFQYPASPTSTFGHCPEPNMVWRRTSHAQERDGESQGLFPAPRQRPAAMSMILRDVTFSNGGPRWDRAGSQLPCFLHREETRTSGSKTALSLPKKKKKKRRKSLKIACPAQSQERKVNSLCSR